MQGALPPAPPALAGGQAGNRYALAGCAGRLHGTTARKGCAGYRRLASGQLRWPPLPRRCTASLPPPRPATGRLVGVVGGNRA